MGDGEIGFHTYSRELAEVERLAGGSTAGGPASRRWTSCRTCKEKVVSIHPGRGVSEE
jgi:hypothetical protein